MSLKTTTPDIIYKIDYKTDSRVNDTKVKMIMRNKGETINFDYWGRRGIYDKNITGVIENITDKTITVSGHRYRYINMKNVMRIIWDCRICGTSVDGYDECKCDYEENYYGIRERKIRHIIINPDDFDKNNIDLFIENNI